MNVQAPLPQYVYINIYYLKITIKEIAYLELN